MLGRIDCVTSWRNVCVLGKELGLLFYASPPSVSLSVTFLKLFSHTCIVRNPHFIPSLCFIHCPESTFYTLSVFYTQSAVQVYTDHAKYPARICLLHLRKCTKFAGTIILSPNNNYSLKTLSATIKTENEEMKSRGERNLCNCIKKPEKKIQDFFQASLHNGINCELRKFRSLRRSFLHFHFISTVHIRFISYIIDTIKTVVSAY